MGTRNTNDTYSATSDPGAAILGLASLKGLSHMEVDGLVSFPTFSLGYMLIGELFLASEEWM
jgi:hypothetical protein